MKARPKIFTVSAKNPDAFAVNPRLIRAQTQRQVESMLEREALENLHEVVKVELATTEAAVELGAAGVKIEDAVVAG